MPKISTKHSGILQQTKNANTNNNIAGYHVVSRRVISISSDIERVMDFQKGRFYYPKNLFQFQICYYSSLNAS